MRYRMLETLQETSPPVDILRTDKEILERLRDTLHLVDPKLVQIDITSLNLV